MGDISSSIHDLELLFGRNLEEYHKIYVSPEHKQWYKHDIKYLRHTLGMNAWKFNIEWGRLFPKRGKISKKSSDFYMRYISFLVENGVKPIICLHHFTNPPWIHKEIRGWADERIIKEYTQYANYVLNLLVRILEYYPDISSPITLFVFNEPEIYCLKSYIAGEPYDKRLLGWSFPPFKRSLIEFRKCITHIIESTLEVKEIAHSSLGDNIEVGITYILNSSVTSSGVILGPMFLKWLWEDKIYELIREMDTVGINYYGKFSIEQDDKYFKVMAVRSTEGIFPLLSSVHRNTNLSKLWISEFGWPSRDGNDKIIYLVEFILKLLEAERSLNVNIQGVLIWTLLQSLEWGKEIDKKTLDEVNFGILDVDLFGNKRRKENAYAHFLRDNGKNILNLMRNPNESLMKSLREEILKKRYHTSQESKIEWSVLGSSKFIYKILDLLY